jgi:hypothetical protein
MMFIMVLMLLLVFRSLRYRMLMRRHQEGLVAIEMVRFFCFFYAFNVYNAANPDI